ncbi:hypothetical protein [Marivivens marinus]|uniref:hypothetical protein n=1 Tax=Marivivens marinus TaxID=3110173 RepID=UPI003B846C15
MMHIELAPVRHNEPLTVEKSGDALILNGELLDLTGIAEGETVDIDEFDCKWLASAVRREAGQLYLRLVLPHGPEAGDATRYPDPLLLDSDGPVNLPAY